MDSYPNNNQSPYNNNQQPYNNNQNYNDYYNNTGYVAPSEDVGVGMWLLTLIGCLIPFVNLIVIIVVACTAKNKTQKNWAIAYLIFIGICVVLYIAIVILAIAGSVAMRS